MIEHCPICNNKFESVMVDGVRRHAICREMDHVLSQEWHMFHFGGTRAPVFITMKCTVSYDNQSCIVEFSNDEPSSIILLGEEIATHKLNGPLDWSELPRILEVMKENIAFT